MGEIVNLAEYTAKQTAYEDAVRELSSEIESWSCNCVGMALALRDLGEGPAAEVGQVVFDPEKELATCTDARVHKLMELSALLHAVAEKVGSLDD